MNLGPRLKELRITKGVIQGDLGKIVGVKTSEINGYEIGTRNPSYDVLIRIADYFNVTTDYLLGRGEKQMANQKEAEQKVPSFIQPNKLKCHVCGKSDHREIANFCAMCGTKLSKKMDDSFSIRSSQRIQLNQKVALATIGVLLDKANEVWRNKDCVAELTVSTLLSLISTVSQTIG